MNILAKIILFIIYIILAVLKTIFIDTFKNIHYFSLKIINPEKAKTMKEELKTKHLLELFDERLKRLERLLYGIVEDASYIKRPKGKYDIKNLKREIK